MMILRPQGLIPEKRHKMELAEHVGHVGRNPLHGTDMSATQSPQQPPSLSNPAILEATNITKQFGGLTAVSDVTFTLPERSIVSIIGPERRREDDVLQHAHGLLPPDARRDRVRRAQHHRRPAGPRDEGGDGADVPEHPPVRDHDRDGERDDRRALADARRSVRLDHPHAAGAARGARGAREGARRARVRRASSRAGTTIWRSTSPTATSGAWRSRARWRRTRRCCCSTSRRRA